MKPIAAAMLAAAVLAGAGAGVARAEVTDTSPAGFEVVEKATISAPQHKIWDALLRPGHWWSSQHTFSGDARNLAIDGAGCLCETLPHGAVRHMTITYADGKSRLVLFGGLGPLQSTGASGHMAFVLAPGAAGTDVTLSYDVGGYAKGGLAQTYAQPVDKVLGEQLGRLKKYVETGKPE